jgi:hypothetical protein
LGRRSEEVEGADAGLERISKILNGVSIRVISCLVSRFQRIMVPSKEEDMIYERCQKEERYEFLRISSVERR